MVAKSNTTIEKNIRNMFRLDNVFICFQSGSISGLQKLLLEPNIVAIFEDDDMMNTIDHLFANNLNISQTSKVAYMHRNTLMYRIEKVKKLIGLNLKSFDDSIIFMNMLSVHNYLLRLK